MLKRYQDWLKTLPPNVQTLVYAIETGVSASLVLFLTAVYGAFSSPTGLEGFNWHAQLYTLEIGVGAAVVKAIIDLLKQSPPHQE